MAGTVSSISLAGCTGDGDEDTPTPSPEPTTTPTPESTPTPTPVPSEFHYESLELIPSEIYLNEAAEVVFEVVNTGEQPDTHFVEIRIDGQIYDTKEVELAADDQETVSFVIEVDEPGEYDIEVGELSVSLNVNQIPPEFEYSNLSFTPENPIAKETITVTLEVENGGGETGTELVELYVGDDIEEKTEVEIAPSTTEEVEFNIEFEEPGEYEIMVDELEEIIEVDPIPAEFEFRDLTTEPDLPEVSEPMDIIVTVENIGHTTGTYNVELYIDEEKEDEQEIEVDGETEEEVKFEFTPDYGGTISVEINDLSKEIEIVSLVGGIIESDTDWTAQHSPYLVQETVQIDEGAQLEIESGVEVRGGPDMTDSAMFHLHGELTAVGDESNSISFEGDAIHTFFDVMGSTENTEAVLHHCTFTDAEQFWYPIGGSTNAAEGSIEVSNCELNNAGRWWIAGPKNDVTIEKNEFSNPGRIRTDLSGDVTVKIRNNAFIGWFSPHDNGLIQNGGSRDESEIIVKYNSFIEMTDQIVLELLTRDWADPDIDGRENFWDTTDHDVIDEMIYDANDDIEIENEIEYEPILEDPHPETPEL